MEKIIQIKNLCKSYGKVKAVENISFEVNEGDFFAFIGPNGAGKSTTIRTLLGLIKADSGEAKVMGLPLEKSVEYLKKIGYLPSEAVFYNNMKVGELISYSAKLRGLDCSEEAKKLCEILELDTKKRIDQLSLGNRKKVGIVCAMQHKPELYIMDEPTSGLDPLMQKEFFKLLHSRQKEGATVFFSSHVLSEVQNNCSKAAIIRQGKIVAVDSIDNLSKTNAKKITLYGVNTLPESFGCKPSSVGENSISFFYNGKVKTLIRELSEMDITDLTITEPDLDEVFMHYYE
ncbi:MAG: ABC transporter ATP-binding protein [Oscillospiraceae bacterium]|nr:ABC transporter ATP-binding protein [Oscillospiraceae bacterium]MBQ8883170.1 ABC transporter ATP-binding protein [Oscillospiraceae bacterium]